MKIKAILLSVAALVAMLLGNVQNAQAQSEMNMAQVLVSMFNSPEMQKQIVDQSMGSITDLKATATGNDVDVVFMFASLINISDLSTEEKKMLSDQFLNSIGSVGQDLKNYGVTMKIHFKDVYGHSMDFTL